MVFLAVIHIFVLSGVNMIMGQKVYTIEMFFHNFSAEDMESGDSVVRLNVTNILLELADELPDLISKTVQDTARRLGTAPIAPKVKLDLKLKDTWLDNPTPEVKSDSVGVWPENIGFPTCDKNHSVPGKAASTMPPRVPFEFVDSDIGKFLEGKPLLANGKVRLNSQAFEPRETNVDKSLNYNVVDTIS